MVSLVPWVHYGLDRELELEIDIVRDRQHDCQLSQSGDENHIHKKVKIERIEIQECEMFSIGL